MTREEAIQFLDNMRGNENGRAIGAEGFYAELCGYHVQALNMAIKALSQQTEYHGTEDMDGLYYCPICQQTTTAVKDGKCPKCGATMDELSTRAQQTEDAISRQAALDAFGLSEKTRKYGGDHSGYDTMLLYEIQQTLEDLPSVTPKAEPCDDAISRQATVERLCKVAEFMNEKRDGLGSPYVMAALFIQDNKDEFPSVTPKQRTGHWIFEKGDGKTCVDGYVCSACNKSFHTHVPYFAEYKYCPNCGCRMVEPQESEE